MTEMLKELKGPIWVVDDDFVRESIVFMLNTEGLEATAFDGGQAFLERVDISKPGAVILDLRMPNFSGADVQDYLVKRKSPLSIIFLSGHGSIGDAVKGMANGAVSFLEKPVEPAKLFEVVRQALEQSQKKFEVEQLKARLKNLTRREHEIFVHLCKGLKSQEIAEILGLSTRTVEVHRGHITAKLGDMTLLSFLFNLLSEKDLEPPRE